MQADDPPLLMVHEEEGGGFASSSESILLELVGSLAARRLLVAFGSSTSAFQLPAAEKRGPTSSLQVHPQLHRNLRSLHRRQKTRDS
jgi:hypothetical protein